MNVFTLEKSSKNINEHEEQHIIPLLRKGNKAKQIMKTTLRQGSQQYTMNDGTTYHFFTVASDDSLFLMQRICILRNHQWFTNCIAHDSELKYRTE